MGLSRKGQGLSAVSYFTLICCPLLTLGDYSARVMSQAPPRPLQPVEMYDVPQPQMLSQLSLGRDAAGEQPTLTCRCVP